MPPRIPPETIAAAVQMVRAGASQSSAAVKFGISKATLSRAVRKAGGLPTTKRHRRPKPPDVVTPADFEAAPPPRVDPAAAPEWLGRFVEGLEAGGVPELAAEYAGVTTGEFRDWLKSQATEDNWRKVLKARGSGALDLIATVRQAAAEGHWQAAAWLLKHTRNDVVGEKVAVETRQMEAGETAATGADHVMAFLRQIRDGGGADAVIDKNLNDPEQVA